MQISVVKHNTLKMLYESSHVCGMWWIYTYSCYLPLDILQQILLSTNKIRMLEFRLVFLWLYKPTLLDVDHFAETI